MTGKAADLIKTARVRNNLTQEQVAEATGLSSRTVMRLENGWYADHDQEPTLRSVVRISAVLDIDMDLLIDEFD